ncbi:MAG TPA: hypothetical protein VFM82_02470 [Flavobacteriaceae bacterium]|nr:hypothetical protein [Flavobacteriaceae bacterium]
MAFKQLTDHIDELGDHIEAYLSNMVAYYKLDFFKKSMKGISLFGKLLIVGSIFLFFLAFISFGFAILIGRSINSLSGGFFIIGGIYLILFILILVFWRKLIERIFLEKFSKFIFNETDYGESVKEEVEDIVDTGQEQSWRTEL